MGCTGTSGSHPPERIILIVVDMLRGDKIGVTNPGVTSPHIDRLAREGQHFDRAVSSFHMTPMSMGSMFTGLTPSFETGRKNRTPLRWSRKSWCGLARFREAPSDSCLPVGLETIAESMSELGYWTLGITSNPLLYDPDGFSQGFAGWHEVGLPLEGKGPPVNTRDHSLSRAGVAVNEVAFEAIRQRESDRFFLYIHYLDVHDHALLDLGYEEGVALFDERLGELLDFLEASSLLEDSVIVLTSDHGEVLDETYPVRPAPQHNGNPSYQTVLSVPLIVQPAIFEHTGALVRGEDLKAMLVSIARGTPESPPPDSQREHFVSETKYQTYRQGKWKSNWPRLWPKKGRVPQLFDLEADPNEQTDVSALHPEILEAHRLRLDELTVNLGRKRPAEAETTAPELDEQARERLRVLGYLDDE